ncbi:MAG TPA: hypothetical protein VGX50_15585 [Longimicrobium sp.]|jgi:hypothetical protein|nr:hypothetical protein [Longimicrobium sp.]
MHLTVIRLDERRYETLIQRHDGVRYHVKGVGHMYDIPHDMAHLAIEEPLGLSRGFWGSVAQGAVFATMTYLDGRRKPGAAERSREVLKANHGHISEAEHLVSIFNNALEEGLGPRSAELRRRLREEQFVAAGHAPREFTDDEIAAVCVEWHRMLALWRELPVGGHLEFTWGMEMPGRGRRPRGMRAAA